MKNLIFLNVLLFCFCTLPNMLSAHTSNLSNSSSSPQAITLIVQTDADISCYGMNDGILAANALPSNTYTYTCIHPTAPTSTNTTGNFSMLEVGTHTVIASDGFCSVAETITFDNPDPLDIVFNIDSMVSCHGNDGRLSIFISGGTANTQPYLTFWTNTSTPGVYLNDIVTNNYADYLENLPAGNYNVLVEDDHGCFYNETGILIAAPSISLNIQALSFICFGGTTSIQVNGNGGVSYPPFYSSTLSYLINNTAVAGSYGVGTYTVVATDAKGCSSNSIIHIQALPLIVGSSTIASCDTYSWNGNTYTNSGYYTSTFTNAAGCDSVHTLILTINPSTSDSLWYTNCNSFIWNGATYTASGQYIYTYTNVAGCQHTSILNLTINQSNAATINVGACNFYQWVNGLTYTNSGTYATTLTNVAGCDSILTLNLTMTNGVSLALKAMLGGAYQASNGLMRDDLRMLNLIPLNTLPFFISHHCLNQVINYATNNSVLSVTGPNAIVDWVFIELRSGTNGGNLVSTQWALIQRDGDIVSCNDGVSPLYFACVCPGDYYVCVKHRNHLGVMSGNTMTLGNATQYFDFSNPSAFVYIKPGYPSMITNLPRQIIGGVACLWGGDANTNKNSKFNGSANDKDRIHSDLGYNPNAVLYPVYRTSDLNMDGYLKFNGYNNDKNWLLDLIGLSASSTTTNTAISQHTP